MIRDDTLSSLLLAIGQDARQRENALAQTERYWVYIQPILNQYGGSSVPDEKIVKERYWIELALLHLLITQVEQSWTTRRMDISFPFWTSRFEDQLYAWYEPTPYLRRRMRDWATTCQAKDEGILQTFSSSIDRAFATQESRRALGEFYTPPQVAQHLADSLQIDKDLLTDSSKIVDPACGSGSLLDAVEQRLIKSALSNNMPASQILRRLSNTLYGFDVQPFAVLLTRLRLIHDVLFTLGRLDGITAEPLFPYICLLDPLAEPAPFWHPAGQFDCVIANPPFSKLTRKRVSFLDRYEKVLYGHPNLYQLFLWWGVKATKPGGRLAFLIPQSFRSGLYFHKLRQQLAATCDLQAITLFTSRIGIFDGVDSPLMTITLQKRLPSSQHTPSKTVIVHTGSNGDNLDSWVPLAVPREKVLRSHPQGPIWCISDQSTDYDILDKVYVSATQLMELTERFLVQNGGFVWNQHEEILRAEAGDGTVPLLSAPSVRPFQFNFPAADLVEKERQFAVVTSEVAGRQHTERFVLVKRTTPKKRGRRIVASLIPEEFVDEYSTFFVENHLNTIKAISEDDLVSLKGLVGWLNSRLLNFVFQLMNGTSHVSVFELHLLPTPVSWLPLLADAVDELSEAPGHERLALWSALDRRVYDFCSLTKAERERIDACVP
jgi:adenine-specific DNA-methyltransferase